MDQIGIRNIHKQMHHTQSLKVVDIITKAKEKYYIEALSDTQPKYMFRVVGTLLSKQETVSPNISDLVELSNKFANFFSKKVRKLRAGLDETDCGTYVIRIPGIFRVIFVTFIPFHLICCWSW